jgi:hypothetical protein
MESKINFNSLIPKQRRVKDSKTVGKLDDLGFFRTPNGSFWDVDEEYFNRNGYDIHGGSYSKEIEYIPGPDWLSELGCYPDEKDKYLNANFDEIEPEDDPGDFEDDFKGDFEDDYEDEENIDNIPIDLTKLQLGDQKITQDLLKNCNFDGYLDELNVNKQTSNSKKNSNTVNKKNKNKKNKKKVEDEDGWETVEEDEK